MSRICRRKNRFWGQGSGFRVQKNCTLYPAPCTLKRAFTLVEAMIVATIFSFIAAGIALSFISGIKLWSRAKNTDFAKYQFLVELESIAKDLRQAISEPVIGFEGTASGLTFPELSRDSVLKVTYSFDQDTAALVKKQIDMKYITVEKNDDKYVERKFAGWEGFSLSYSYYDVAAGGYIWADEWKKEKGIFTAVKINGKFKGETYTRVIFIHTA